VSVALRTTSGSRRRSSPFNSIRSKAYRSTQSSFLTNAAMPRSSHATASSSMMQDRDRKPRQRFDDQGEPIRQVVARPAVELHPWAILDPEAVVLPGSRRA
jgi:hypothetical protein